MENQIIEAATLGGSVADMDFSIWSLFVRADAVVKAVIILLLLASVWCWAIIFDKVVNLRRLNSRSSEFEQSFWSGNSLGDLYGRISASPRDPMSFLATTGSTAPFIGLFGTVWGIMNSFQAIAISKNTSLAVVAPGIAEALFATALGLLAAIPAVVAYNKLNKDMDRYASRLDNFAGEFSAILSREMDTKEKD
jgi:biopolymer transport protein TolQ